MALRFSHVVAVSVFAVALQFHVVTSCMRPTLVPVLGQYFCEQFNEPYCRCFNPAERTYGLFPNRRNQTARDAGREFGHFVQDGENVIKSNCSNKIGTLLCFFYFPLYDHNILKFLKQDPQILPCRELCEEVRRDCLDEFVNNGYSWPDHLDCSEDYFYPWWSGKICVNGTDPVQGYDACISEGHLYTSTPAALSEDGSKYDACVDNSLTEPPDCPGCSKLRRTCTSGTFIRNGYTWAARVRLNNSTTVVNGTNKAYVVQVIKQYLPDPEEGPRMEDYTVVQTTNPECCGDCPDDIGVGNEYLFSGYYEINPLKWELDIRDRGSLVSTWTHKYSKNLAKWIARREK